MNMSSTIDPKAAKAESERTIVEASGRICDWLPILDITQSRERSEIVGRAIVINALLQLHFGAPTELVRSWIQRNNASTYLSACEKQLLDKTRDQLTSQEKTNLYWYIEALWAMLWIGGLIDNLRYDEPIQDFMSSLCPGLHNDEDASKFSDKMEVRSFDELFQQLDLYYRLHWWARHPNPNDDTERLNIDIIMERRKSLEWVLDRSTDWDDVDLST